MKKNHPLKFKLAYLIFILSLAAYGKQQGEKRKYIEKTHRTKATTALRIENKFGDVEINSWAKSEVSVKVEIIAEGKTDERAQKILDNINIVISETSSMISYKTDIPNSNNNKSNDGFEVNYIINMPEDNPLKIRNSFGDVTMGDRLSDLNLNVSYGSLKVGDVKGNTTVKLSFGSGSIGQTNQSEITVKYGEFDIESGQVMELEQGFSDVEIGEVNSLEIESKYGNVEIENVQKIDAEAHYSGFEIEELTGELKIDCSYLGNFSIGRLAKSFTLVDIDGKFGSYEINLEPGLNANVDAEFSFADLKVSSDVEATFNYQVKESNSNTYRGKIGKGDPNKLIRIDSGYGDLRLRVD